MRQLRRAATTVLGPATENTRVHHTAQVTAIPALGISFDEFDEFVRQQRHLLATRKKRQDEGEALIEQARAILMNTDILETIAQKDAERAAANAK